MTGNLAQRGLKLHEHHPSTHQFIKYHGVCAKCHDDAQCWGCKDDQARNKRPNLFFEVLVFLILKYETL